MRRSETAELNQDESRFGLSETPNRKLIFFFFSLYVGAWRT